MKRTFLLATIFLMTLACRSVNDSSRSAEIVSASFRPGWFGSIFSIRIRSDGAVQLTTREWANNQTYEVEHSRRRLSERELERLRHLLVQANIAALSERYETRVTDQDEITVSDPRTSRTVVIYGPENLCDELAVAPVIALWNEIVRLTNPPRVRRRGGYRLCTSA